MHRVRMKISSSFRQVSRRQSPALGGAKNFRLQIETRRKGRRDDIATTKAASRRLGNKDGELRIPGM